VLNCWPILRTDSERNVRRLVQCRRSDILMLRFKELIVLANLSDLLFSAENRPGIKRKRKTICGCYGSICL